jgi:hypothetical protein
MPATPSLAARTFRRAAISLAASFAVSLTLLPFAASAADVAVAPQYDTTHVYVSNADIDAFVDSFVATFGGKASPRAVFTVTPTPSKTASQYVQTPVGMLSVFAFQTPIPYGFGDERNGYLVHDVASATDAAVAAGADVTVAPFDDPIGKDAVVLWAGGIKMQLYWHTKAPSYPPLQHVPDNRVYLSPVVADRFVNQFTTFSGGSVTADEQVDGGEIGRPNEKIRRIRISSGFGTMRIFVSDGKLPWPFGRETTGYEVNDLTATLAKAAANKATLISPPYPTSGGGRSAMVQFPGGYIAEIHDAAR